MIDVDADMSDFMVLRYEETGRMITRLGAAEVTARLHLGTVQRI